MFSYFTSIVRVSEVKRERLFSGCTPEADKAELTEREPHALITHLFIPIASRHRHYDSQQSQLTSNPPISKKITLFVCNSMLFIVSSVLLPLMIFWSFDFCMSQSNSFRYRNQPFAKKIFHTFSILIERSN